MGFIKKGAPKIAAADERRATTPAATPPGTPFSVILAKKKRESADAAACAAAARAQAAAAAAVNKGAVAASHSSGAAGKQGGHWSETTSTNGGGTQSGGGGGSSSKSGASRRVSPRALMRKYRARVKARTGLYLAFALVELIAAGAFILCIASGYNAVVRNYAASATDAIAGVHEGYTKKVSQMRNLVGSTAYNFDVQAYLKDPTDPARAANAKALVEYIASVYRVEYCNILGSDMRIMMGANNDRTGELFNPEGIVTAARALNGSDSAWTYGRHTYADLLKEGAPISWDRESTLDESFKGGSQYNYKGDGVIRWVAIAINTVDFQTFSIIDPDSSEGFIIMGDVINGKASSTTLTSTTVGGLAAVYTRRNDTGAADGAHWLTGSSSVNMGVAAKTGGAHTLLNVIVQGFSPYSALGAKKDALMDTLFARANTDTRADTRIVHPYSLAARKWLPDSEVEPTGGRPELILTRGIAMDASLTVGYVWQQVGYLAGVILVDVFTLCLATFLFLVPLEAMGKRVRNGQRVDVGFLKSLTRRKRLGVVIAAVAAFSLLWGIGIEAANRDNLARVIVTRSKFEPGGTMLSYRQRPDQISRMLSTMQLCTALRGLLAAPSDAALLTFTAHRLTVCEDVMDSEIALLYGANATLLVAPHAPALKGVAWDPNGIVNDTLANGKRYTRTHALKGVAWDPNGIVNDTLANGKRYTRTAIMTPAELAQFNGTRKFDQLSSTTGVSALDPSVTGEDVLVRWMAVPMWIGGPTSVGPPSGALLMGDIVNGKTRTLERANKMAGGRGYSAVYFYNSTSQYQMASALMRVKGGLFDLDVPLPETAWLDTLRKSVDWHIDDHFTITKSINFPKYGGKHVVSARCINKNMVYQSYGADVDPRGWDGQPLGDCWGYLIQGLPWCAVAPSLRVSYVWQWVFVAMCVAKLVAMGVLCWRAYLPFRKIVVQNKFVQGAHRTVTSPAAQKDANASATATLTATMQN